MFEDTVGRELSEFEVAAAVVGSIKLFEPRGWSYYVVQEVLKITNITSASLTLAENALLKTLNFNMFPIEITRSYQGSVPQEHQRLLVVSNSNLCSMSLRALLTPCICDIIRHLSRFDLKLMKYAGGVYVKLLDAFVLFRLFNSFTLKA